MFPKHNKITTGFVVQTYITLPNGTMVCQHQRFIAGDPVEYEDLDKNPIEVDTDKEVYCPFEMKRPKQIPDEKDAVKFVCPACPSTRLEACLDGSHTTAIDAMFKSGGIKYGDTYSNGDLESFQCVECDYIITIDDENRPMDAQDPITDDEQLVEWCKENCNQE